MGQYIVDNYGKDFLVEKWSEKNLTSPFTILIGSNKKVWFKCTEKNYHPDYEQAVSSFVAGYKCPYCTSKKIVRQDSWGEKHQKYLSLWSDLNTEDPYAVSPVSSKSVYWKCENGKHKDYKRKIHASDSYEYRCPLCAKENQKTPLIDISGQKFGYLTVLSIDEEKKKETGRIYWKCLCRCGRETSVLSQHIRSGNIQSCGCLHREKMTGIKKWDWSKAHANENYKARRTSEYSYWRESVLKRDNYTCQCCGSTSQLQAHHKNNFNDFVDQRYDVNNGVTLCRKCHVREYPNSFHAMYGVLGTTEEQFNEYIKIRKGEDHEK